MEKQQEPKQNSYWKSLDEKYQTPEFLEQVEKEFHSSPFKEAEDKSGLARRQFMKLMGASIALSSAACVRRPVQKIIPYNKRPSEVVIGIPNYYASSLYDGREGFAITVKTREGRPLHLQGNEDYPGNGKGLSARGSAQILALYDPDRIRTPIVNSQNIQTDDKGKVISRQRGKMISVPRDWDSLDKKVASQLEQGDIRVLTSEMPSPTLKNLLDRFVKNFSAKVHTWTPINNSDVRVAAQHCFGRASVPKYRYDKAKMIVSVDADFLGSYLNPTESSKLFINGRDPDKGMSRLVSFQTVPSLTSLNADDNYGVKASLQLPLVLGMIHELCFVQNRAKGSAVAHELCKPYSHIYESFGMDQKEFAAIVKELADHAGEGLVVAGGVQAKTRDAVSLQIAVNYLNDLLGNNGNTIQWSHGLLASESSDSDLSELIEDINAGKVKTLIINDVNPNFNLPKVAGFAEVLNKVDLVVATNNWMDETACLADLVAPTGHAMENWGDNEFEPGLVTIQQPTLQPLHNTRSFGDSLMVWSKGAGKPVANEETFFDHLQARWKNRLGGEQAWFDFLQKGFSGGTFDGTERTMGFNSSALEKVKVTMGESPIELSLYAKVGLYDGSMANVSWLQELPDPMSKIVWDNYLVISPTLAKEMKVRDGDMVDVKTAHHNMTLPIFITPGQNAGSVAVAIGYGRTKGGDVQKNVGFDVQNFIEAAGESFVHAGLPVELRKTGKHYQLAQTQGHFSMEGRQLAVETTEKHYRSTGDVGLHKHKIFSIWNGHKYDGHKWGMGVDLNACTGCSACMIACQSENNIPVVGKKYVLAGREMHWIRIDRYFTGDEHKSVDSIFQPVMCQHCENAPCETVCPVLATVHSDEGLNDMVYNRCVGTRYCSNNCPYKVRRFNWFYYGKQHTTEPLYMALNPEVTVRTRGVMEKCSFCVQRIKEGKNIAKDENRELKDGDIKTACQSVCPTNAIVFGDLNDKESQVAKWFESQREYTLLEEFNAAPRVRYLAKVRNTPRDLGGGHHGGHQEDKGHAETEHKEGH